MTVSAPTAAASASEGGSVNTACRPTDSKGGLLNNGPDISPIHERFLPRLLLTNILCQRYKTDKLQAEILNNDFDIFAVSLNHG